MSDEQMYQIDTLSKALDTQANTIRSLEKKLENAKQIIDIFEREKKSWAEQKVMQDHVMQQQLATNDSTVRRLQEEVMELKAKLKAA